MKTIAYYISDYGYGHAARSIAIIRKLLAADRNLIIIICHSFALPFIKKSLSSKRVSYREIQTDIGYILKRDSIFPDKDKLLAVYNLFVENWGDKIQIENKFLSTKNVNLVISDISPLPFEAAANLNIPSVGLSNFTWYTAYENLIEETLLSPLKRAYEHMTYFFSLSGNAERNWGKQSVYEFFAREINSKEIENLKRNAYINGKRKHIVFLGIGMKMEQGLLENLPIWDSPDCVFLVSSNIQVAKQNVISIPSDYTESQNYIAASDLVITKAGWGTVSEAVVKQVPLLLINRESMKEDRNTIEALQNKHLCETIQWEDFQTLQLDRGKISAYRKRTKEKGGAQQNQAVRIANDLLAIINKK
ncbi:MAG: glycosyltransferase [Bacillus sp. (in: firmicutes)]